MKLMLAFLMMGSMVFATDKMATKAAEEKIMFMDPVIYAPVKGTNTTAGYVMLHNMSAKEVKVKVVKAEPFKAAETHETTEKDGRMSMKKVDGFTVPANGMVDLAPGGNHIMLFDASKELKVGDEVTMQLLVDEKTTDVKFKVVPRVENKKDEHANHHH